MSSMCSLFDELEKEEKSNNPFNNARVYLSGKFSKKSEVVSLLESVGAVVKNQEGGGNLLGLSKDTCVIIAGDDQSNEDINKYELLAFDGYHIPTINEAEMRGIISGDKSAEFPKPLKMVDITYDFLFNSKFSPIVHLNFYEYTHPLAQREIYMHDIDGEGSLLYQCLGNIGAYAINDFDPKTTDFCWLKKSTIDKLKIGEKDKFIAFITDKYNSSNSTKFNYKFLIEQEVVFWLEFRAREIGDDCSLDYITRYKKSIYK